MKKIKAYLIFLFTGWRSVKYFGNPKEYGVYLAVLENNHVCWLFYSVEKKWYEPMYGYDFKENHAVYWKPFPKPPFAHT